jgi:hypothetical protein
MQESKFDYLRDYYILLDLSAQFIQAQADHTIPNGDVWLN